MGYNDYDVHRLNDLNRVNNSNRCNDLNPLNDENKNRYSGYDIIAQRSLMYGDFENNCQKATLFKKSIIVHYDNKKITPWVDLSRWLLSLKASRSVHCQDNPDAFLDCKVDFLNYHLLLMDVLRKYCKRYSISYTAPFVFTFLDDNSIITKLVDY